MDKSRNDLMVYADSNQRITYANPVDCNAFGISDEKVAGYDFMQHIYPKGINYAMKYLKLLEFTPNITHHEERGKTVQGWTLQTDDPVSDDPGAPEWTLVMRFSL